MMTDQELVKICLADICAKAGFAPFQRLTQRDLEFLCDVIEEKTQVLISLSTMKRLLNGQFSRLPQVATLNAISIYLGYENWQDFKLKKKNTATGIPSATPPVQENHPRPKRISPAAFKIAGLGIAVLAIGVVLASKKFSLKTRPSYDKVLFTARKTTHNNIPNTVIFNYNIDQLAGDSFFIQQSWDRNRRVRIYKNNYTLTDIYYEPGYHNAKLIVNDQVVKTIGVSIPTDRWFLYAQTTKPGSIPVYINKENAVTNGVFGIGMNDLASHHINVQEPHNYIYTYFPRKLQVSGDNFSFTARVRMINLSQAVCPRIMLEVFCQKNFMYFITSPAGCTGELSAQFGDSYLSGKTNDLSGFGCDVLQWQQFNMVVKNRQVTISINRKEVFTQKYTASSELIAGLGFISNGLCEIDSVDLRGLDGTVVYSNNFDQ